MSTLLQGLFAAGLSGPLFPAAWRARTRVDRWRWLLIGGLAPVVAQCSDPLAVALRQVDGVMSMVSCRA